MKILEFMVGVKKGSWCKSWKKKKYFFRFLSERQNLALYEGRIRTLQSNNYSVRYLVSYILSAKWFQKVNVKSSGCYFALCPKDSKCVRRYKVRETFII